MMHFFHMTEEQALDYPLIKAFALAAWKIESNPWSKVDRLSEGYVAQERARLKQ